MGLSEKSETDKVLNEDVALNSAPAEPVENEKEIVEAAATASPEPETPVEDTTAVENVAQTAVEAAADTTAVENAAEAAVETAATEAAADTAQAPCTEPETVQAQAEEATMEAEEAPEDTSETATGAEAGAEEATAEATGETATEAEEATAEATGETAAEAEEAEATAITAATYAKLSKAELVEALAALVDQPVETIRDKVAQIKVAFYNTRNAEIAALKEEFLAKGNEEAAFAVPADENEARFKDILNQLKEKRAEYNAVQDALRAQNLEKKRAIIDEIKAITDDPDNINKQYSRLQQLQQEFRAIGEIPAANNTEIWKTYQRLTERFYDLLKMNKVLRDYDFKKNLEIKQQLCAEAEALGESDDVVASFKKLQELHNIWRETGPVAKDIRDELWTRFKDASAVVNKKYQAFFEGRKEREKENEAAKTAICEQVEAIDISQCKTYAAWDEATKKIIALQGEWKKLGFASRKVNADLFARFRKSCDEFFARKAEFFKAMKEDLAANLQKKIALCEKAEALRESTDWKKTTDELVALQKEWKTIGPVVKKHSDTVWKRFISACDYFFEQKSKQSSSTRQTEHANLKAKRDVIAAINAITASEEQESDAPAKVRELMRTWQDTGHVPYKEKDKLYKEYRAAVDKAYEKLDMRADRYSGGYESASGGATQDKAYHERERIVRAYEQKRQELKTYENNMGFFNAQSTGGNNMLKVMERRIEKIKEELEQLEQKIQALDSKL